MWWQKKHYVDKVREYIYEYNVGKTMKINSYIESFYGFELSGGWEDYRRPLVITHFSGRFYQMVAPCLLCAFVGKARESFISFLPWYSCPGDSGCMSVLARFSQNGKDDQGHL